MYAINNLCVVSEFIFSQFSHSLKIMVKNTFFEPQPDSASYQQIVLLLAKISGLGTEDYGIRTDDCMLITDFLVLKTEDLELRTGD